MHYSPRFLTGITVFLALVALYTVTSVSARDPTSIYFRPRKGYAPRYSAVRRQQAEAFLSSFDHADQSKIVKASTDEKKRKLCVGIPSVKRHGTDYLRDTVGSLLQGLTPEERQEIYLIVFIAHSKPEDHQPYNEKWLQSFADQVLTYNFGFDRMRYIRNLEQTGRLIEKGIFDYAYILDKCTEQFTPHIAIIEDDVVAMDGWYHRTLSALQSASHQAALRRSTLDFFYLRLFYTESFLGWHHERWLSYLIRCVFIALLPTVALLFIRIFQPRTKLSMTLTTPRAFLALYASLALVILFYFSLGHITVAPVPTGVHEMPRGGCCSQAHVYPHRKAQDLVAYLRERRVGWTDVLIEDFANERGEARFAISPSVVQHVGRETVGGEDDRSGRSGAGRIWSFAFEKFEAGRLGREHQMVVGGQGD